MPSNILLKDASLYSEKARIGESLISSKNTIPVLNPATGKILGHVPNLGRAETEQAIAAAERALIGWKKTTAHHRAELLNEWHRLIVENI